MNFTLDCYGGIYLYYEDYLQTVHSNECTVVIDRLLMYGKGSCKIPYHMLVSYIISAWIQPSARDSQWVKYFKVVILKMPIV